MAFRRMILSAGSVETHTARREMHLRFQAFTLDGKDKLSVEVAKDEKLGQGAQGSVYRGILDGLGRPTDCAVKSYQYNEDFLHELENLKNVRSVRGCIEVIGFGYGDGGSGWILFPRYERSLTQLFKTDHSGSSSGVAFLGIGTLFGALCALHKANFIHLDVKPSNVVCRRQPQGSYRLIDFSTLRPLKRKYTHKVCWSEYARRSESAGPWSDVFGAGATALEYMIWLIKGPEGVENFRSKRKGEQKANDHSEETAFFDIHNFDTGVSGPSKVVQNYLDELEKHFPVEMVAVIKGMLEVDSSKRLSMKDASTRWKICLSNFSRRSNEANETKDKRTQVGYVSSNHHDYSYHGLDHIATSSSTHPRVINISTRQIRSLNGATGQSRTDIGGRSGYTHFTTLEFPANNTLVTNK
ncbi:kinase-like domain-containing protein [Trichophaea hybrida]|nr:kinase-like domain-containing protein [Trichophaea hybrida]